jgi:two-component system sensor histidine kinase and response regulator WspE
VSHGQPRNPSQLSMHELFRVEVENQTQVLTSALLELERNGPSAAQLETLMRSAHSLKGAARIINLQLLVGLAHSMEDLFVAAQKGNLRLARPETEALLRGVDLFVKVSKCPEGDPTGWEAQHNHEVCAFLNELAQLMQAAIQSSPPASGFPQLIRAVDQNPSASETDAVVRAEHPAGKFRGKVRPEGPHEVFAQARGPEPERVVRLSAENLNRLLALAGESLVESRWLRPFADSLQRLKRQQADLSQKLQSLRLVLDQENLTEQVEGQLHESFAALTDSQQFLSRRMEELDAFDRRSAHLSHRLYLEVLRTRMRPFNEGTRRFPRMVRDLAKSLGKNIGLEILGDQTQVDRDILERLETPIAHLLRNAVDHGCETPPKRAEMGKPPESMIRLEARHSAGMLMISVSDDGAGVDLEQLRSAIVGKRLAASDIAEKLSESELLEFLFLPGFTMKDRVTELSGRGVGLDIVQNMVKSVRGSVRINTQAGRGLKIQLHLPLTLSVLRALLVEIGGEPYAIPLTQIVRTLKIPRDQIESLEGRHHFNDGTHQVSLLTAHQVLECGSPAPFQSEIPVIVLGDRNDRYGLVVDRFLGERELVVQPLDPRLGKIKDISAAALMEDGSPVLIVDVDDLLRSIESFISHGLPADIRASQLPFTAKKPKRILAVDDSLTVRELERKLLTNRGYVTDVAVDGMDGWNAVRTGNYDLVLTDVDMPRMDGIELASLIKRDPKLKATPVMIISYKDHEADRMRGLEAGADYYLTKGSFQNETLLQAVVDLIGEPES